MARVLVVDDDRDILVLAEQILLAEGHTVVVAEDALRAIDWLNQIQFDLMISDVNMPLYSGFDLINTIRNDKKFKDLSIVMLTAMRDRKDVEKAIKAGADDYIVKPLDPHLFIQKVNSLFAKRAPTNHPEIDLSGTTQGVGTLLQEISVEGVSELGIRVTSPVPLKQGQILKISARFFTTLEIDNPPHLKVLHVDYDKLKDVYRAQLIFMGAREEVLTKIRRWIYSHGSSLKVA